MVYKNNILSNSRCCKILLQAWHTRTIWWNLQSCKSIDKYFSAYCCSLFIKTEYFLKVRKYASLKSSNARMCKKFWPAKWCILIEKDCFHMVDFEYLFSFLFRSFGFIILSFMYIALWLAIFKTISQHIILKGNSTSFATYNILQHPQMLPNVALCAKNANVIFLFYIYSFHTFVNSIEIVWI